MRTNAVARREAGVAITGLALAAFAAARLGIRCPVRSVFGIDCPGCGGTRAVLALLHRDVPLAVRENAAVLAGGLAVTSYLISPSRTTRAAAALRAAASRHRVTRWWARHPEASALAAAGLWCAARNLTGPGGTGLRH